MLHFPVLTQVKKGPSADADCLTRRDHVLSKAITLSVTNHRACDLCDRIMVDPSFLSDRRKGCVIPSRYRGSACSGRAPFGSTGDLGGGGLPTLDGPRTAVTV